MKHYRPVRDKETLDALSTVSKWKSPLLIFAIYLLVILLIAANVLVSSPVLFTISFIVIAGLQSHLLILLHEGAHTNLHPNTKVNKLLSNIFCAYPFATQSKIYASLHLAHHRYSGNSKNDPEVKFYALQGHLHQGLSRSKLIVTLLQDILGWSALRTSLFAFSTFQKMVEDKKARPLTALEVTGQLLTIATIVLISYLTGTLFYLLTLWVLPYITLCMFFIKVHGYGEHNGQLGGREIDRTYTHEYSALANFFYYPIKSGYHFEHHCYPNIPWYNVEKLRAIYKNDKEHQKQVEATTLDGIFFGKKTIINQVLRPQVQTEKSVRELDGIHIDNDADSSIEEQLKNT